MSKNIGLRIAVLAALMLASLIYLVPSMSSDLPSWWSGILPQEKIHLGLDLQGGVHLTLQVEAERAVESHIERVTEDLRQDLRKNKIRYADLKRTGTAGIELILLREEDGKAFTDQVAPNYQDFRIHSPVKSDKGILYAMAMTDGAKSQIMRLASDQALETIRNRIDQFGVSEPDIRPQAENRILVQLPGVKEPERAKELIGRTALLEFKLVDEENSLEDAMRGNVPPGSEILHQSVVDRKSDQRRQAPFLLKRRTLLTGEYITDARVAIDSQYSEPYVSLSFDSRGARLFERITGDNVGKRLAIVLDGNVYSAPVIRDKIGGGRAQITGSFSMEEAKDLAIVLRAGALPAPVKVIEERTVGPSLGRDSIDQGFRSMLVGGIIVLVLVAFYYNLSGLIAALALILNVPFIMAGLAAFGATLTLPGIAGIILTIGMAVDANVLVYERIKEELRFGKPARGAVEAGYARAMVTILDSNITTLIAALVLFQFGTGPVKGFAVTLTIGLVSNIYTAVFVTRIVFDYLYVQKRWKTIRI